LRYLRTEICTNAANVSLGFLFDAVVIVAFATLKLRTYPTMLLYAAAAIAKGFGVRRVCLSRWFDPAPDGIYANYEIWRYDCR